MTDANLSVQENSAAAKKGTRRTRASRKTGGISQSAQVLNLVRAEPGIISTELRRRAASLGLKPDTVSQLLYMLGRANKIRYEETSSGRNRPIFAVESAEDATPAEKAPADTKKTRGRKKQTAPRASVRTAAPAPTTLALMPALPETSSALVDLQAQAGGVNSVVSSLAQQLAQVLAQNVSEQVREIIRPEIMRQVSQVINSELTTMMQQLPIVPAPDKDRPAAATRKPRGRTKKA